MQFFMVVQEIVT